MHPSDISIELSRIFDYIDHNRGRHILVVGDIILDRYVFGSVSRVSPEAPIPVLLIDKERDVLGGAANVAANIAQLGAPTVLISVLGDDSAAERATKMINSTGAVGSIRRSKMRATSYKTRYLAGGQQLLRVDEEKTDPLAADDVQWLVSSFKKALVNASFVVFSDYAKGLFTPEVLVLLISACKEARVPVLVDPKRDDFSTYRGATYLTPNQKELSIGVGRNLVSDTEIEEAINELVRDCDFSMVFATRASEGITVTGRNIPACHVPARAVEVFDVSGAGDTVAAILAVSLSAGSAPMLAAHMANLGGGVVVSRIGTAVINRGDLMSALRLPKDNRDKIVTGSEVLHLVKQWRHGGLKVGFTNGCFDLLHPGHTHLLSQAKSNCDRLVVGLNTDASVQGLKGPDRPIRNWQGRAGVLAALADVDAIVGYDDPTPIDLIRAISPDVLVKGADYKLDDVVGGSFVIENGGRVFLAELLKGESTTATITKMSR